MKHLLKLLDVSEKEILEILNLADQLKYERKHGIPHRHLEGKSLGMIFQKASTRTRLSFETGMYQLGGQALFLSNRDLQIGRGEPVQDYGIVRPVPCRGVWSHLHCFRRPCRLAPFHPYFPAEVHAYRPADDGCILKYVFPGGYRYRYS